MESIHVHGDHKTIYVYIHTYFYSISSQIKKITFKQALKYMLINLM